MAIMTSPARQPVLETARLRLLALEQPGCHAVWGDPLKTNEVSNRLLASCGAQLIRETEDSNLWKIAGQSPANA